MMREGPLKKEQVYKILKDAIALLSKFLPLALSYSNTRQGAKHSEDWRANSDSG